MAITLAGFGGNGPEVAHLVAQVGAILGAGCEVVADAEAIYSYEGTREMNTLIVGKALTGLSAFI